MLHVDLAPRVLVFNGLSMPFTPMYIIHLSRKNAIIYSPIPQFRVLDNLCSSAIFGAYSHFLIWMAVTFLTTFFKYLVLWVINER